MTTNRTTLTVTVTAVGGDTRTYTQEWDQRYGTDRIARDILQEAKVFISNIKSGGVFAAVFRDRAVCFNCRKRRLREIRCVGP